MLSMVFILLRYIFPFGIGLDEKSIDKIALSNSAINYITVPFQIYLPAINRAQFNFEGSMVFMPSDKIGCNW